MAAGLLAAAAPASAAEGWSFALSPYVWLPGLSTAVDTPFGRVEVDNDSSEVLNQLNFAFMGAAEARKDRWGLILDVIYSDLNSDAPTPLGVLFSSASVDTKLTAFTTYAAYRVYEDDRGFIDLLGGGRFYSLDVDLILEPGVLDEQSFDLSETWADPVFGARGRVAFGDKWYATALADYGGFAGESDDSWQALATVGYQFNPAWSVQGGWRYMSVQKRVEGLDLEIGLNGPIVGLSYRF